MLVFVLMADQTILHSTPGWLLLFRFSPIINTHTFYSTGTLQHRGVATRVFGFLLLVLFSEDLGGGLLNIYS